MSILVSGECCCCVYNRRLKILISPRFYQLKDSLVIKLGCLWRRKMQIYFFKLVPHDQRKKQKKERNRQSLLTRLRTSGSVSHSGNTMGSSNRYVTCLRLVSGHPKDSGSFSSSSSSFFPSSSSSPPPPLSSSPSSPSLELSSSPLSSSPLPPEPSDPPAAACRRDYTSETSTFS